MSKIGYIRVSTEHQETARQQEIMCSYQVDRIFSEKLSGANTDRPQLRAMLDYVREGDTLYIESISRLGRSTKDLLNIIDTLTDKGVTLISHKEKIDTDTPAGKFMLTVFAALSQLEREQLKQRQREGIEIAKAQGKSVETIKNIIASLHEFNPMMGHRGCRLAVTYPEIAKMQTKAVIKAALNVKKNHPDWTIVPEIMIPLVGDVKELKYVKNFVVETADAVIKEAGADLKYEVGTMIEIPRAALTADEIAKEAEFFCFGTNDLTQMTYGFSRDDAGKFLNAYYDAKIFENDPFSKLDQTGVGKLMEMAIKLGKATRPDMHIGICGEHGGDPSSVEFCHKIGLNYVSCSPFRVPIARIAAAQAAIEEA